MTAPAQRGRGTADPWGPVPTDTLSLANAAPVLLPFFNNGPVFGLPGTVADAGFWNNTQLSGDWGGRRTELARNGFFFDVYTTSAYQDLPQKGDAALFRLAEKSCVPSLASRYRPRSETHERSHAGDQGRFRKPQRGHHVLHIRRDPDGRRQGVVVVTLDALTVADRAEL
jgi:hypothetical protein